MVQTFVPAGQLVQGQLVYIGQGLATYVGRPELARCVRPVTVIERPSPSTVVITLAATAPTRQGYLVLEHLEVLPAEAQRPLAELEAMTADALTAHALAFQATRGASPYLAMVIGLLARELDEDEPAVADRIQAAADTLVTP